MSRTELCYIMNKNQSDKSSSHHNYTLEYDRLFYKIKETAKNIFEVGLGTNNLDVESNMGVNGRPGASLYGWKEYFKNANIFGGDVDSRILFQDERIKTFFVDQTKTETIQEMWNNDDLKNIFFDVIIDDGLHKPEANINFFKHSYHKINPYGIYIIEDVYLEWLKQYTDKLDDLQKEMYFRYDVKILGNPNNTRDNCLIVIYLN